MTFLPSSLSGLRGLALMLLLAAAGWAAIGMNTAVAQTEPSASPASDTEPGDVALGEVASGDVALGLRLYREGVLADGSLLRGKRDFLGQDLRGAAAACVACHRRSGLGMSEGARLVPPIAGPLLFAAGQPYRPTRMRRTTEAVTPRPPRQVQPLRHLARSAYDDESLARALRSGMDPDGHQLDPLMPVYALGDADIANLAAYLRTLDPHVARGLEPGIVHLATVITPDAPGDRVDALTRTLDAWANRRNIRQLRIRLHVWSLEGAPDTWRAQLDAHLAATPVYAVVSGAGRAIWAPVRDFCEDQKLPCVLPIVDEAQVRAGDFYSVVFSAGVSAEARVAANGLASAIEARSTPKPTGPAGTAKAPGAPIQTRVLQAMLAGDRLGELGAQAFEDTWASRALPHAESWVMDSPDIDSLATSLRQWARAEHGATSGPAAGQPRIGRYLVLWLNNEELAALVARLPDGLPGVDRYLVAAQLVRPRLIDLPPAWRERMVWASTRSAPLRQTAAKGMSLAGWLTTLGLGDIPGDDQAEVYSAVFYLGDALARMRLGWSADYLMETLEQAIDDRPAGAQYLKLSLGPGQRVAAKVGALIGLPGLGIAADGSLGRAHDGLAWQQQLRPLMSDLRSEE